MIIKLGFFLLTTLIAAFVAWLFWGPLLHFLWSLIPASAEYAWVGKLACTVLVGWFGGIVVPLFLFFAGLVAVIKA